MAQITRSQLIPLLVEACPSYAADWNQFRAEYVDDPEPFLYVASARFARHLSEVLAAGDRETVQRVFVTLERLITEGDHEVQETAVVGIVKNLQNASLHQQTVPDDFVPFLQPESERWWEKVGTFRSNGRPLTEE